MGGSLHPPRAQAAMGESLHRPQSGGCVTPPSPKGRGYKGRQRPSPVPSTARLHFGSQQVLHQGLFWPNHSGRGSAKWEKKRICSRTHNTHGGYQSQPAQK